MTEQELNQLKYPIGKFKEPEHITHAHIETWIEVLERFPSRLAALVLTLK